MSRCPQSCGGPLNPWNYEATPAKKAIVATLVAAAAIAAVVGGLAILASGGVNLHAFNILSVLKMQGGVALAIANLLIAGGGLSWLASKTWAKKHPPPACERSQPETIDPQLPPIVADEQPLPPPPIVAIETYEPLEALKLRRVELLHPLSPDAEVETPETFQLLEDLKAYIDPPSVEISDKPSAPRKEIQIQRQREAFANKVRGYIDGLVRGKLETTRAQEISKTFEGELTHPAQVGMVLEFAQQQLAAFNLPLPADAEKIDVEGFMEAYEPLQQEAQVWERLLDVACAPVLGHDQLGILEEIKAPTHLKPQFQALASRLAAKPTTEPNEAQHIFRKLGKRLKIRGLSIPASPTEPFVRKLTEDIQSLFQYESAEDEVPLLKLTDIKLIREYIHAEEQRFFEIYSIDIDVYQEFRDIETLEKVWTMMDQLIHSTDGIDAKIEVLTEIAHTLPETGASIWEKYHVIRDCIGLDLTRSFAFRFFSSYEFTHPLNPDDQERKIKMDGAFELMARKLGCKQPELPVIEMDTANDSLMSNSEFEAECQKHALQIRATYDIFGAQLAAQCLIEQTSSLGPLRRDYMNGILEALPGISTELTPYLADILFD